MSVLPIRKILPQNDTRISQSISRGLKSGLGSTLILSLVLSLSYLVTPTPAHADTITIGCNSAQLIDAIASANESDGPDTIELSPSCIYKYFNSPYIDPTYGKNALPAITGEITFQGNGATVARDTLSPNSFRVFELTADANVTFYHVTISGGDMTNPAGATSGGGIFNLGRLTLDHVTLSNNRAWEAGGIRGMPGSFTTVISSIISANVSIATSQSNGGGIENLGDLTVIDSLISANSSTKGGGGIYNKSNLTISQTTITGNSSTNGAGIDNDGGTTQIVNSTLYNNTATNQGGGLYNGSVTSLYNVTVYKNSAANGGGLFNLSTAAPTSLVNTIVAQSNKGGNCVGNFTDGGHNLHWPSTDPSCPGFSANPKLNSLGYYGGTAPTLSLQSGSAASNNGDNPTCLGALVNNVDQRNITRYIEGGPNCDIGAFEGSIDLVFLYLPVLNN